MSSDPISKYDSHGMNYCTIHTDTYPYIKPSSTDLSGRYVLITGASKGLGYDMALSYTRGGAAGIAIAARSSLEKTVSAMKAAAAEAGVATPRILTLKMDVADRQQVAAAGKKLQEEFGRLDILLLNAGVLEPSVKVLDQDIDVWWQTWTTNILGSFLTLKAFLPTLLATEGGLKTVVGLSSIGATLIAPGHTAYQPAKMALCKIMEQLNVGYQDQNVLAYAVHPGGVPTEMGLSLPQESQVFIIDTPQLAADSLVFLTKERREWLAGRWLSCKWDMEEFLTRQEEVEKRDLLKFRLPMGGEDWSKA